LIQGEVSRLGVLIGVRFCARCAYRAEVCPACGLDEPYEDRIELNRVFVPVLLCDNCGWYEPLPPEFRPAGAGLLPD
jgi:ferredoxin